MAIVRTTPKESNTSGTGPNGNGAATNGAAVPIDRTKSVVPQAQARTVARTPGARPAVANRAQMQAKTGSTPQAFVNDTMTELRRVVWPSKAEVQAGTIVTIGLLFFFSIYIFGLDYLVHWLFVLIGLYPPNSTGIG